MSSFERPHRWCIGLLCLLFGAPASWADEVAALGEAVADEEIARIDYTVLPDGEGLPAGSGTAVEGRLVYRQHCLACHGDAGRDGLNDTLAGGHGTLTGNRPEKTLGSYWPYATTVFDYVRRAMPHQSPGVLSDDDLYAVTAYLLHLNGIIGQEEAMNADTLPAVRMPNRDGFVWDYLPGE